MDCVGRDECAVYFVSMTAPATDSAGDECYRCGYDLRGIANDGACPECGLLAERSRRVTEELHDTRPRWLRSLSRGINLILLAIVAPFVTPVSAAFWLNSSPPWWISYAELVAFDISALLLLLGDILLTLREGYAPADQADRRLRILMRVVAIVPVGQVVLVHVQLYSELSLRHIFLTGDQFLALTLVALALFAFLPLLLFLRLRGLARRVRSAHLAEHCIIVGVGAFLSTLYLAAVVAITNNVVGLGLGDRWQWQTTGFLMMLLMSVASCLFILWSLYLLIRFAVAFWKAARKLRRKWIRDDRSLTTGAETRNPKFE